jgi:hypothetical protein
VEVEVEEMKHIKQQSLVELGNPLSDAQTLTNADSSLNAVQALKYGLTCQAVRIKKVTRASFCLFRGFGSFGGKLRRLLTNY